MTDLNLAYGFLDEPQNENLHIGNNNPNIDNNANQYTQSIENNIDNIVVEKKVKKKKMNIDEDRPLISRQKEAYQMSNMSLNENNIPEYPYAKKNKEKVEPNYENTFWNRLSAKRYEIFKLVMFSLVILFAISLDRISTHYLTKYINENVLTDNQELIIRFAYPVLIILVLWILKAL